jgi:demethylmenaquinone methyltransferase/2-methoxy-6-polyprenyl-1,4-benzoquinol methylase
LGGENRVRRALIDVVDLQPGDSILDMCCGTGNTTFGLAEKVGKGSQIKAIDLSFGQIVIAKKNLFPNIEFIVMDASNTCFIEGDFDKVVIPHALHEMPRATRLEVLKEAKRILKDGGTLAVLEMDNPPKLHWRLCIGFFWFYWLPFNPETPTRKDMLRYGVAEEVEEAGFKNVTKISMYHSTLQVVRGRKQEATK